MKSKTMTAAEKFAPAKPIKAKKDYEKKIARAVEIQTAQKALGQELEAIKQFFMEELPPEKGQLVTTSGTVLKKVACSYSVNTEAIAALRKIFGEQFPEYVDEKHSYGATAKLKKLLADADYKHSKKIREAVTIRESYSVQFLGAE